MSRDFLLDTGERLLRVFAVTMLAQFGADVFDVRDVNWGDAFAVSGGAVLGSLLLSLAAIKLGSRGTASLTHATVSHEQHIDQVARAAGYTATPQTPGVGDHRAPEGN